MPCHRILTDAAAELREAERAARMMPITYQESLSAPACPAPLPTTLYRLYGAEGIGLLYIGIAGNPGRRFEQHAARLWWGDVRRVDLEHFPTRAMASRAEVEAIRREAPIHNKAHNTKRSRT